MNQRRRRYKLNGSTERSESIPRFNTLRLGGFEITPLFYQLMWVDSTAFNSKHGGIFSNPPNVIEITYTLILLRIVQVESFVSLKLRALKD